MMKTAWIARLLLAASASFAGGNAFATPITFTFTGMDSGTLNSVAFAASAFTITENDDTSARQNCGGTCEFIADTDATISIAGLGSLTFVTGTRIFSSGTFIGFSRAGLVGSDLYDVTPTFAGYDLMSSTGPLSFTGNVEQWTTSPVVTSGGVLVLNNATTQGTFQARLGALTVPEPESVMLLVIGFLGLAAVSRRRS